MRDPWLLGSCYWRTWWNFPEPDPHMFADFNPKFVYLTHLHWDHFHGPSLKKLFSPDTTMLVPKAPTLRMVEDLRWLGFHRIVEIPHGGRFRLGQDFDLSSYQFGLTVDSAAVISGGGYTLFNCNDCKFFGLPLRQILREHPKIDFLFRSHSSAGPVPFCIDNYQQYVAAGDPGYDSADQFARCAIFSGARYAIPFASNHCFLHPETRHYNATVMTPELARQRYTALARESGASTECVVMPPGSSWDENTGFTLEPFDFSRRDDYVQERVAKHAVKLDQQLQLEMATAADFGAFREYFHCFLKAMPWLLRRWLMKPIVFRVVDAHGTHHWVINPKAGSVEELPAPPVGAVIFDVPPIVINDCVRLKMFSVWSASKRLKIHLPAAAALASATLWFTLLDLYEVDVFPLSKNLTPRNLSIRLRRWREPVEVASILARRMLLRQRFSVSRIYPLKPAPRL